MTAAAPLHFHNHRLMLDPLGAVAWPECHILVVADLHFEKASAAARRGFLIPPFDTGITLDRLTLLIRKWRPRTVIALGDTFHDTHAPTRLTATDANRLHALTQSANFIWVQGNHDPAPTNLPGQSLPEYAHAGITFRHQAAPGAAAELCGHHHPKATVETRAGRITRPCFVTDPRRLMLPALGAYTGGLEVANPAIARLFPRGGRAFLLGNNRLFSFELHRPTPLGNPAAFPP